MTPGMVAIVAGLFGLIAGSFLNVCIHRLPRGASLVRPPSHCPLCHAPIRWFDNVPILGYLWLRGRCRSCRALISPRYVAVEALTAAVFVVHAIVIGPQALLAPRLVLAAIAIALFAIDLEHHLLPDALTFPGIAIGLGASLALAPGIIASVEGALLGAAILLAIRWTWRRATGVEGMGLGDVKMLAMIGAFLGWQQVILVLFLSSLAGAAVGISLAWLHRGSMRSRLPFGTFLAVAAIVASLWGDRVIAWYASLYY